MKVGVLQETYPGERRVALVPASLPTLEKAGLAVLVQSRAGEAAGYPDDTYRQRGAEIAASREDVFTQADIILQVRSLGANPQAGQSDVPLFREGQTVIGMAEPLTAAAEAKQLAGQGVNAFALELIPRITRAQSMDVLSSMATVAGYRAVLLASLHLPKMFPMLMTAAGTITAAKVFVIGAGVAGLQAIATSRKLGGVVQAYDVRPAVKEQVESLGAKFVMMELETESAEGKGGYAKAMGEEFYQKQRALMASVVAETDVVVTTAAIPGKPSPRLISKDAVEGMAPGSVIVDLAAERGGNCEVSAPDEIVVHDGVTILGPTNLPSEVPYHASQMFSKNITTFLLHLYGDGQIQFDLEDEITRETLVARGGQVVHPRLKETVADAEQAKP